MSTNMMKTTARSPRAALLLLVACAAISHIVYFSKFHDRAMGAGVLHSQGQSRDDFDLPTTAAGGAASAVARAGPSSPSPSSRAAVMVEEEDEGGAGLQSKEEEEGDSVDEADGADEEGDSADAEDSAAEEEASSAPATTATSTSTSAAWRPRLFLHIGPSKTATTTIQHDLAHLSTKSKVLEKDDLVFWGRQHGKSRYAGSPVGVLSQLFQWDCMVSEYAAFRANRTIEDHDHKIDNNGDQHHEEISQQNFPDCLNTSVAMLGMLRRDRKSLIISDEKYTYVSLYLKGRRPGIFESQEYFRNFHEVFQGWDVTVIIGYRRMAEWMVSSVKERNAKIGLYEKTTQKFWPDQGGMPMQQPWSFIRKWTVGRKAHTSDSTAYIDVTVPAWERGNFTVHLLNIHNTSRHMSQQLVCDTIGDATTSCSHLEQNIADSQQNTRSSAWSVYNQIVFAAASRGLISKDLQAKKTRIEMTDEFEAYFRGYLKKTVSDLPLVCPTAAELEKLLNTSLAIEQRWMPTFYRSADGEAAHRAAFEKLAVVKREFCSVDTARLFDGHDTWDAFLQSWNSTSTTPPSWKIEHRWEFFKTTAYPKT